jgi:hypothetical protein
LRHGALVDGPKNAKCSPLLRAAAAGALEACALLLAHGADVNLVDRSFNDRRTPLLKASAKGHVEVAALLLRNGAKLDAKDAAGDGAWRLSLDHPELRALLLTLGVESEPRDAGSEPRSAQLLSDTPSPAEPTASAAAPSPQPERSQAEQPQPERSPAEQPPAQRPGAAFGIACPVCAKPVLVAHRSPCCRRLVCSDCNRGAKSPLGCGLCKSNGIWYS